VVLYIHTAVSPARFSFLGGARGSVAGGVGRAFVSIRLVSKRCCQLCVSIGHFTDGKRTLMAACTVVTTGVPNPSPSVDVLRDAFRPCWKFLGPRLLSFAKIQEGVVDSILCFSQTEGTLLKPNGAEERERLDTF
jgi:hypothetical protein